MQRYDIEETLMEKRAEGEFVKFDDHQAALDAVMKEAETFASKLLTMYRFAGLDEERSELMQEVKAFLASPAVRDYRARQEQG